MSHFARSQWLGVLKAILAEASVVIPDVVEDELRDGAARHGYLQMVLDADWIDVVRLDQSPQITAFTYYSQRLVGPDGRNAGECGVLALAEATPRAIAVVDDRVARNAAKSRQVEVRGTLGLLCDAIRQEFLTVPLVSALADDLLQNSYRLPFGPGGFAKWASDEGLL
ncbi:nucleotide-binding protein [Solwaraspora sp. WMMD791]|uniref:nucleotide-binding protein n=1 Tax=Solwaraspora sp. WMMD791 TaxID=3016086 RepID=UPI00249B07F1|nr:nucleotide-binding protein [Solwaraspora sp. WMMD791]WFE26468.1 nucleotide-binding protein [Solwaraspora sp. WMMD791]